jgi:hypothetical protein
MPEIFEPKLATLPAAQRELWPLLAPAPRLSYVLYGGTAVALHLGHRVSVFKDGDLPTLPKADQDRLRHARDRIANIPVLEIGGSTLATASGPRPS